MAEGKQIFCNRCNNHTRHTQLASYEREFMPEEYPQMEIAHAQGIWEMWQCLGCDEVVFLETWITSEDYDPSSGESTPTIYYYPERNNSKPEHVITTKEFEHIPNHLNLLYHEIIDTYNNGNTILCAVGLRALIEGICVDKGILDGPNREGRLVNNLEGKINGMQSIVPVNIASNLHSFRFMGNDAVHDLSPPSIKDLSLAIVIVEDILNIVYDLDYKTSRLFQNINDSRGRIPPAPMP